MIRRPPGSTRTDTLLPDTTLVRSAAEGERPARLLHRGDARLPLVPGFTSEVIDAARRERRTGPLELPVHTAAQPQAGRGTERDADDVLEHRAVLVPANAGTGMNGRAHV